MTRNPVNENILGETITLPASGLVSPNRMMKAAMSECLASWDTKTEKRGIQSEELVNTYKRWGEGGWGIILTGNVIVNPEDLESAGNAVIYRPIMNSARLEAFKKIAEAAKAHGSLVIMQLSHGGRQTPTWIRPNPISASDIQLTNTPDLGKYFGKPRSMTKEDIKETIDQFAFGAEIAFKTGYHGVQLHAGHGYLLAQFLSESTNKRMDEYGGPLPNRARIIYEIIQEIKGRIPNPQGFSISIKINSAEFQKGGFKADECREVCKRLEEIGIDFVELSGGTFEQLAFRPRESTKAREAFFLEFADIIRPALKKVPVFVTGGYQTASAMIKSIQDGSTDGIGIGRPAAGEPYLAKQLISGTVTSKIASQLDYTDFLLTNQIAGSQIRQMAFGKEPMDTSEEEEVKRYGVELKRFKEIFSDKMKEGIVIAGRPRLNTGKLDWEEDI